MIRPFILVNRKRLASATAVFFVSVFLSPHSSSEQRGGNVVEGKRKQTKGW